MTDKTDTSISARAGRALNELVMAELFLVQASIESATALGDSLDELRDHFGGEGEASGESLSTLLRRSRERLVEPYSTRFRFLREVMREDEHKNLLEDKAA